MDFVGRGYGSVAIGDTFSSSVTVTDAHLVLGAGLIVDYNPLHVDHEFASRSRYGSRILHGMLTSALMGGPVGMYFSRYAVAYLEHAARFKAPVRVGDTLRIEWRITALLDKSSVDGGIVTLAGVCQNQAGTLVAEADARMLVSREVVAARAP